MHRDLKPGNIKIRPDGSVKVLDFGLAKTGPAASTVSHDSPTLLHSPTLVGVILGTAAYMAPEQARGKIVDRRVDIWAFGVVVYEMLSGKRLFEGEDLTETLASVVKSEPNLAPIPRSVRRLIVACLQKDPQKRLRDIGDAWRLLDDGPDGLQDAAAPLKPGKSRRPWIAAVVFASAAALGLGYISYSHVTEDPPRLLKATVLPPDKGVLTATAIPAISPDGRRIALGVIVAGKTEIWVRDLDALTARPLPGTDDGQYPFWSPDSRSIGFFQDTKLKRIDIAGGPAVTVCDTGGSGRGGTWARDVIVFSLGNSGLINQVPAAGGAVTNLFKPDTAKGETLLRWPWFLPDGRHFLYSANNADQEKVALYVADLVSRKQQRLLGASSNAVYVPPAGNRSGHLLFVREGTLMVQPFNAAKPEITGDAVPIAESLASGQNSLQYQFSASLNGALVFQSGASAGGLQLAWFDHSGKPLGATVPNIAFRGALSPDESTIALDRRDFGASPDIWLYDLKRGAISRFTFGPGINTGPVWSPDGRRIAFISGRDGIPRVFERATNAGVDQLLTPALGDPPKLTRPLDWSRDGRYLVEETSGGGGQVDLWVQPIFGDRKPFPYLATRFNELEARISPDGKWLAYASDETARVEVYVQSFPMPGAKAQVSTGGGAKPVCSSDGKLLYFIGGNKMMAVDVKTGDRFEAGVPRALFDTRIGNNRLNQFDVSDVSKDGRFLIPLRMPMIRA